MDIVYYTSEVQIYIYIYSIYIYKTVYIRDHPPTLKLYIHFTLSIPATYSTHRNVPEVSTVKY
jgi:hypothetical protein